MRWRDLLNFGKARELTVPPKPKLARRLWSMWRTDEQDAEKLKALAASGRRIEDLMAHPGWQDVLSAKAFYLSSYDAQTKQLTATHEQRLMAAATWTGIEGFFKELSLRVHAGRDAYEKLKRVN